MSGTPLETRSATREPLTPGWSDIQPKVTASALAYSASVAATNLAVNEFGLDLSQTSAVSLSGFLMLLAAYLWPNGRHNS